MNYEKITSSSISLAQKTEYEKNSFLSHLVRTLEVNHENILQANSEDMRHARNQNMPSSFLERLTLTTDGLSTLIDKVREMKKLNGNVGEILEERTAYEGVYLQKRRVPIGVIFVIYEARPEVTIDVAALCIKSGNAAILKGGSEALYTNRALLDCISLALEEASFDPHTISLIASKDRNVMNKLLKRPDIIDLVIARGSYTMVNHVQTVSSVPVLAHSAGGVRIYVDESADISMVEKILINAKTSKPSACNSLDTIVLHKNLTHLLPHITKTLVREKVKIVENEWDREFLGLEVSIKTVQDVKEAIRFINAHSKKHSEGIIAEDKKVIQKFVDSIDAAAIFINCSSRLHDGYIFGLGSEMGIATGKLHARGPVGLHELTTYKWIMYGKGHVRE